MKAFATLKAAITGICMFAVLFCVCLGPGNDDDGKDDPVLVCPDWPEKNPQPGDPQYEVVSPNGGEVFYVGEPCTVRVTAQSSGQAAIRLVLGLYSFMLSGMSMALNPRNDSVFVFTMPDKFIQPVSATESDTVYTVTDSALIKIHDYASEERYADHSDCYFSIREP
jgi:hypothetical protein